MQKQFEVIVVGAGPAGIACAHTLAMSGVKVLLLERGEHPGSKNVMGGVLYSHVTDQIIPGFWKQAPLERHVVDQRYWFTDKDSAVAIGYKGGNHAKEPYNAFTVFRAKFDRWFADQAVKAGAVLVTETNVVDLIYKGNRVVGVKTGRDNGDIYADVVVLAEGVNSLLAQKAGLKKFIPASQLAVAVKEVISLPREKIEDRFNVENDEGVTIELIGDNTKGMIGTGFIYTNKDSISIGVGALMSQMIAGGWNPNDLLEGMKAHPLVRRLISGGKPVEYLAHMIPEGGFEGMPKLYRDGLLVAGDSAMFVNGVHREGSNLAMLSGKIAAETIIKCRYHGDYSTSMLSEYEKAVSGSFIGQDLKHYRHLNAMLEEFPHFFKSYPKWANLAYERFLTVDSEPKAAKLKNIAKRVTNEHSILSFAKDAYRLWRVIR